MNLTSTCIGNHLGSQLPRLRVSVLCRSSYASVGPKFVHSLLLESSLPHPILRHPADHRPKDACQADPSGGTGARRWAGPIFTSWVAPCAIDTHMEPRRPVVAREWDRGGGQQSSAIKATTAPDT